MKFFRNKAKGYAQEDIIAAGFAAMTRAAKFLSPAGYIPIANTKTSLKISYG